MFSKLKKFLGGHDPDYPRPALEEGEEIILEGVAARVRGLGGARWGPLILTNRRLLWYETANVWPLRKISGQLDLSDIASVDKGSIFDVVFGGRRIRLRLRNGKIQKFYEGQGRLDEWVETIRRVTMTGRSG